MTSIGTRKYKFTSNYTTNKSSQDITSETNVRKKLSSTYWY